MLKKLAFSFVFIFAGSALATVPLAADRTAIHGFAGCFEVSFDYAETIALQAGYQFHPGYHAKGLEWVELDLDDPGAIALQHILLTDDGPQKHWREEWDFEADARYQFHGGTTWDREAIAAPVGQWLQRVFQVDDSLRYECSAPWIRWGTTEYWECQTSSPLPRREFSKRSDYNILDRRSREQILADGFTMEEDNVKWNMTNDAQTALVKEKGENRYHRVDDARCLDAKTYWHDNRDIWHAIQSAWKKTYATHAHLQLKTPAAGQLLLWQQLFDLADQAAQQKQTPAQVESAAQALIDSSL